ncbi:dynein regulatory complex protein 1-like [Pectinophora gossypiella]|uniref:dynein regulatory complex protein 1-like n=1 Tax=Pectinophora gossypiella TaxID=13191 RepID=UPI00214E4F41|nr:dynein regulatory complex protein 1-like [Pectinophora gossypiella]
MFDEDEEDVLAPKEPQVTSEDPEERKAARALRIKRRQEAIKRAEAPSEEALAEEEAGLVEQTTAAAAEELQRLALDGAAKVTNVKVTVDEREVVRRATCAEKMKAMFDRIEEEAVDTQLAYEAVATNWETMLSIKDPLDIDVAMKEQKVKCDELLAMKDSLIDQLKNDLKSMDIAYYEDLEKQDKDIKELSERVERQVTIMQRAYDKQLSLIEAALNVEREEMVDHNNKRWEALYKQRDKEEVVHIAVKAAQLEAHKDEIERIMWDHHDKYREAKTELETLIQELQKELEKLKATCLINTEKIGYNYQVLKKREEENLFVRSQQKRKLNKMSDVANALRAKIRKAAEDGAIEEMRADEEIVTLMQAMDNLEKKAHHFAQVNDYKFMQVWRMSRERCSELLKELRHAEVALHAHVLAEPPPPPPPKPPKSPLNKKEGEVGADSTVNLSQTSPELKKDRNYKDAREKLVRHILQLVADNTGFLVEDRLLKLIEKFQQKPKNLCTLDAIFMALEIQADEDIELLCETFLNYAFCPICVGLEDAMTDVVGDATSDDGGAAARSRAASAVRARASIAIARSQSTSTSRSIHVGFRGSELSPDDQLLVAEADEIIQKCGDPSAPLMVTGAASDAGGSAATRRAATRGVVVTTQADVSGAGGPTNPFLCPEGHNLEIEPMQVLTALGEFISKFVPPEKKRLYDILDSVKPPDFSTKSRRLTTEDIEQYWAQWKNFYPPEKDKFWEGMLTGLQGYLHTLQEREKVHSDVVVLRKRNAALRKLVRGALPDLVPNTGPPPQYLRSAPAAFTAAIEDLAPKPTLRLPPI